MLLQTLINTPDVPHATQLLSQDRRVRARIWAMLIGSVVLPKSPS
jgi:hypothetical protein